MSMNINLIVCAVLSISVPRVLALFAFDPFDFLDGEDYEDSDFEFTL